MFGGQERQEFFWCGVQNTVLNTTKDIPSRISVCCAYIIHLLLWREEEEEEEEKEEEEEEEATTTTKIYQDEI